MPQHTFDPNPRIIGYRPNGAPIWRIAGGSEDAPLDGDAPDAAGDADGDDGKPDDSADEPEKDWKAEFEAQQKINRSLERKTKKDLSRIETMETELDQLRKGSAKGPADGDTETLDAEELRKQVKAEARVELMRDRVHDKIEAKAAKGFADPEDAAALVMRGKKPDDFLDDDKVDVEAIEEALEELLKQKPYLAAQGGKRFQGSGDGGARPSKPQRPKSIAEAVAKKLNAS